MSFVSNVYGRNPTKRELRARSHTVAPVAMSRGARILTATAAVECNDCTRSTMNGMIVDGQWLCLACAHKASER